VQLEFALLDAVTTSARANANIAKVDPFFGSILPIKKWYNIDCTCTIGLMQRFPLAEAKVFSSTVFGLTK
jgi:hypothetical protein